MFTELNTAGHHDDVPPLELLPELQLQQSVSLQIVCIEDICLGYTHGHNNTPVDKKNDIIPKWKPSLQPPISWPNLYQI